MSSSTTSHLIALHGNLPLGPASTDEPPSHQTANHEVFDKLDGFILAAKQLEAALQQERSKTRKLQEELKRSHIQNEQLFRDNEIKSKENQVLESKLSKALNQAEEREKKLQSQLHQTVNQFRKIRAELLHYKSAWAEVLQREREAKLIIEDGEKLRAKTEELVRQNKKVSELLSAEKSGREQAERHAKSYQNELQATLLRLHSADSKFSQLSKEYELLIASKRNFDEEVAKVEKTIWERYQWTMVKEKEKIRAEMEREAALERESYREILRMNLKTEMDRELAHEREKSEIKLEQFQNEAVLLRDKVKQARTEAEGLEAEKIQLQNQVQQLISERDDCRASIESIQNEANQEKLLLAKKVGEREAEFEAERSGMLEDLRRHQEKFEQEMVTFRMIEQQHESNLKAMQNRLSEMEAHYRETERKSLDELESRHQARLKELREENVLAIAKMESETRARAEELASVRSELADLKTRNDELGLRLNEELEKGRNLESAFTEERQKYDIMVHVIRDQLTYLEASAPFYAMREAKDAEIQMLETEAEEASRCENEQECYELNGALSLARQELQLIQETITRFEGSIQSQRQLLGEITPLKILEAEPDRI